MPAMSLIAPGRFTIPSFCVSTSEPRAKILVVAIFMFMGVAAFSSPIARDKAFMKVTIWPSRYIAVTPMTRGRLVRFLMIMITALHLESCGVQAGRGLLRVLRLPARVQGQLLMDGLVRGGGGPLAPASSQGAGAPDGARHRRGVTVAVPSRNGGLLLPPRAAAAVAGWATTRLAGKAWLVASWPLLLEGYAGSEPLEPPLNGRVVAAAAGSSAPTCAAG